MNYTHIFSGSHSSDVYTFMSCIHMTIDRSVHANILTHMLINRSVQANILNTLNTQKCMQTHPQRVYAHDSPYLHSYACVYANILNTQKYTQTHAQGRHVKSQCARGRETAHSFADACVHVIILHVITHKHYSTHKH